MLDFVVEIGFSCHKTHAVVVATRRHLQAVQASHDSVEKVEFVLLVGVSSKRHTNYKLHNQSYINLMHFADKLLHLLVVLLSNGDLFLQVAGWSLGEPLNSNLV